MIRPINVGETLEYVLKDDKESPTIWILAVLDSIVKSRITDLSTVYKFNPEAPKDSIAETRMDIAEQELQHVRFGLKGFKNFNKTDGAAIPFKTVETVLGNTKYTIVSDETIKFIPKSALSELASKISEENELSGEEEKN